jgi:glycosyltransferase involved in cell wall biosynthesis
MHILLLPSTYPSKANPTLGIFYRDQAQALHKAGHKVGVLVTRLPPGREFLFARSTWSQVRGRKTAYNDSGVSVYEADFWSWIPNFLNSARYRRLMAEQTRALFSDYRQKQGAPDLIHAHTSLYGGFLGASLKGETGLPLVLTEHSSNFLTGQLSGKQLAVVRSVLQASDRVLAVSLPLAQALEQLEPACKVSVLGNIVDTDFFVLPDEPPPPRPFVFSAVGSLRSIKNFELLIRAFGRAFSSADVVLRIAGEGSKRKRLEALIRELHLESRVQLEGRLSRDGVRSLIQGSHAIVSSSWHETFGVALIEALSAGRPIIATRSGGPEGFVDQENGILVPVDDEAAFVDVMRQMVRNWDHYDPRAIRAACVRRFGEKAVVEQLAQIYGSVQGDPEIKTRESS